MSVGALMADTCGGGVAIGGSEQGEPRIARFRGWTGDGFGLRLDRRLPRDRGRHVDRLQVAGDVVGARGRRETVDVIFDAAAASAARLPVPALRRRDAVHRALNGWQARKLRRRNLRCGQPVLHGWSSRSCSDVIAARR